MAIWLVIIVIYEVNNWCDLVRNKYRLLPYDMLGEDMISQQSFGFCHLTDKSCRVQKRSMLFLHHERLNNSSNKWQLVCIWKWVQCTWAIFRTCCIYVWSHVGTVCDYWRDEINIYPLWGGSSMCGLIMFWCHMIGYAICYAGKVFMGFSVCWYLFYG